MKGNLTPFLNLLVHMHIEKMLRYDSIGEEREVPPNSMC